MSICQRQWSPTHFPHHPTAFLPTDCKPMRSAHKRLMQQMKVQTWRKPFYIPIAVLFQESHSEIKVTSVLSLGHIHKQVFSQCNLKKASNNSLSRIRRAILKCSQRHLALMEKFQLTLFSPLSLCPVFILLQVIDYPTHIHVVSCQKLRYFVHCLNGFYLKYPRKHSKCVLIDF